MCQRQQQVKNALLGLHAIYTACAFSILGICFWSTFDNIVIIAFTLFTHWCINLFGYTAATAFNKLTYLRYLNVVEGTGLVMPSTT